MRTEGPDEKVHEALSTVGQYLSDTIAPVQAAESVETLLKQPTQLMMSEIIHWVPAQFQVNDKSVSVADYLFHAVSKLHYLAHLQLISEQALAPYLDSLKQALLDHCPQADRRLLQENFSRLGTPETAMAVPISLIYRQARSGRPQGDNSEVPTPERPRDRRRLILLDRLKYEVRQPLSPVGNEDREEVVPNLIATAASHAQSSEEFREFQENLKSLGIDSGTNQIFRTLSQSLPGWMIATNGTDALKSRNAAVQAMCQIIHLSGDHWEGRGRFKELIEAAVEQFNTGSLARAATMFDLALGISSDETLDPVDVESFRKTGHESLDMDRMRSLAKDRDQHRLLQKVLSFFDEFSVKNLLDSLQKEERRDRRRMLLSLLEAHGDGARTTALERLKELLADTNIATDWHFARNLICILTAIPRSGDASLQEEMELVAPLFKPSLPAPLIKEAIKHAGQTRCSKSEDLLISTADNLERGALDYAASGRDPAQRLSLLDRTIFELAHYGTPRAYGRVVKHGTGRSDMLGDTAARLTYLSNQDLTADQESVAILLQFLKSKTPRRLLGMTILKNEQPLTHTIKALSSTPTPIVRQAFEEIAAQFPETKFGMAAAGALKEFGSFDRPGIRTARTLTGDLELFGLPDLLQNLNQLNVTGTLTLKNANGNLTGRLSLHAGHMRDCTAGRLRGKEAAYQLLEKPIAGTFVFQGQKNSGNQGQTEEHGIPELNEVLSEGMRRYDELQRARAVVPDFALLRRKGPEPIRPPEDQDAVLFDLVWPKTAAGTSPEECEAICPTDSYRVRTLLACWVEGGVLIVE